MVRILENTNFHTPPPRQSRRQGKPPLAASGRNSTTTTTPPTRRSPGGFYFAGDRTCVQSCGRMAPALPRQVAPAMAPAMVAPMAAVDDPGDGQQVAPSTCSILLIHDVFCTCFIP
jgi:hypothetical protein